MNTPTFPSQASSMSTSLAPITHPAHSYLSNQTVEHATALIALIHKSLQQNATMIAQFNSCPSPHPPQPQLLSYQFKPQRPLFPKWEGTPPTTPLFLAHIETYKAKALYTRVHVWTQTTPTNRKLSVTISSDMLASLPSSILSMFLNDSRFASEGITMLSSLLTHINPSSNEKLLLAISDLTCLEMRLGDSSIDYMLRVCGIAQRMQGVTIDRIIPLFIIASLDHERYPGVKSS